MTFAPKERATAVSSLAAEYIRAYLQNPNFNIADERSSKLLVGQCLQMARQTVEYTEAEYNAVQ